MMQRNATKYCMLVIVMLCLLLPMAAQAAETEEYRLEKVLVLSRHNIRAPLAGRDSVLGRLTPHDWFHWQAAPGELSQKGGELETLMGQYFCQWLAKEGLMGANYEPAPGEMRFYANSFQRTIATAQYFSSGMLPVANVRIEHKYGLNEKDPIFLPGMPEWGEELQQQAEAELEAMGGSKFLASSAVPGSKLIGQVLDFSQSEYAREKGVSSLATDDLELAIRGTYTVKGSLRPFMQASDALVLQYYEEPDDSKAAFGQPLTTEEWKEIAHLKEMGINALYGLPTISTALATPLLRTMANELTLQGRKFTFLCGHDTNLAAVMSALGVEDYELPGSIEARTPIGAKLVIEKRRGVDGQAYARLCLVYATTEQLRQRTPLSLQQPPAVVALRLKGLDMNKEGLYMFADLQQRFVQAIEAGGRCCR